MKRIKHVSNITEFLIVMCSVLAGAISGTTNNWMGIVIGILAVGIVVLVLFKKYNQQIIKEYLESKQNDASRR